MEAWKIPNLLPLKQEISSAFTIIFGKYYDKQLDDGIIAMVDYIFLPQAPKFIYTKDLSMKIKAQLVAFKYTRVFRY